MKGDIDLRPGTTDFRVTTQVQGPGNSFDRRMGPDVIVTARDVKHALEVVKQAGHEPNPHFPPTKEGKAAAL